MKNVAVVGSRTFKNGRLLEKVLEEYLPAISLLISGGARGADVMAAKWARQNRIKTEIFLPDRKRYRHAYHHRNRLIVEAADMVVAFWDGHSSGTKYTIDYARRMGKPVKVVRFS